MYVLGIDAGGTKTVCLLADEGGRVLAEARGAGANLQASGELEVEKVLHQLMSTRWIVAAAVLVSGVGLFVLMPPSPIALEGPQAGAPMRGAIHVHTRRSDGTGTVDEVAAAARRDGLQFVIFTDHGDGTKGSDTPAYRYGVLCIDALEVSTNGGHVVVLGLPQTP